MGQEPAESWPAFSCDPANSSENSNTSQQVIRHESHRGTAAHHQMCHAECHTSWSRGRHSCSRHLRRQPNRATERSRSFTSSQKLEGRALRLRSNVVRAMSAGHRVSLWPWTPSSSGRCRSVTRVQIAGPQPTLSAALATSCVKRFAKRRSAFRPSLFFLANPRASITSLIDRLGCFWLVEPLLGARRDNSGDSCRSDSRPLVSQSSRRIT